MKRRILFFFFVCLCTNIFGQMGYRVGLTFKELYPDNSSLYFVQTKDVDQMKRLLNNSQNKQSENVKIIASLADNACIANSKSFGDDYYVSEIYKNRQGYKIIILPRIAIKMKEGYGIESILNKYHRLITLDKKKVNLYLVDCYAENAEDVLRINDEINTEESVEWCEPMVIGEARKLNPLEGQQYYLKNVDQYGNPAGVDINAEPAWDLFTVDTTLVVAVIDDGVERNHEDLAGSVIDGYTIGYPSEKGEPINEFDLYIYDNILYYGRKAHGTACAGIIGARDNNIGIRGVASGVKILPINVHPQSCPLVALPYPTSWYESVGDAITWAYSTGNADVISCSMLFDDNTYISNALNNAMNYGRNGKGTVVVCASGFSPYYGVAFPANMSRTIAVGAVNSTGVFYEYSGRGSSLDIVAPCADNNNQGNVVTTDRSAPKGYNPSGNYTFDFAGTSASCPQVAGVAALMLSYNPNLTVNNVKPILQNTACKLPGMNGLNRTNDYGYGLVDAFAAVYNSKNHSIVGPTLINSNGTFYIDNLPNGVTVEWILSNSYYNQNCLQQNYPSTNQCRITRSSSQDLMNATLTAYIKYNGVTVQTLTKTGVYAYADFKGHYTSGNLSGDINYTHLFYVKPYYNTYITSPNFYGATVTYSNIGTVPNNWGFSSQSGYLQFIMPTNNGGVPVVINVTDGCGNYYQLYAMPQNSKNLNISPGENSITIMLNEDGDSERGSILDQSWTVEIRNAATGALMTTKSSSSRSETISTAGWPKGIYAVKATVGKEVLTEKVIVK